MSANIFQSGFQNIGARAVAQATDRANKYNQELTKREMISQTEESLGGVKLFTSGRELGSQLMKSKLKPYLKQQAKKLFKKAKPDEPDEPPTTTTTTTQPPPAEPELPETTTEDLQSQWDAPDEPEVGDGVKAAAASEEPEIVSKTVSNVVGKGSRRVLTNDNMDAARAARVERIGKMKIEKDVKSGMSRADAESKNEEYLAQTARKFSSNKNLNDASNDEEARIANEQEAQEQQATARAAAKPEPDPEPDTETQLARPKPKIEDGDEEDEEDFGKTIVKKTAAKVGEDEGADITAMEAGASVLDAIPGLDIIGVALGAAGLIGGLTKKPPHELAPPPQAFMGQSNQVGI